MPPIQSTQLKRKRQALLFAPLLFVPILTIIFVALGGGKGLASPTTVGDKKGYNATLPGAHLSKQEGLLDKLGFYKKAEADSEKLKLRLKGDPYLAKKGEVSDMFNMHTSKTGNFNSSSGSGPDPDTKADELLANLQQLKKTVSQQQAHPKIDSNLARREEVVDRSPELARLENLLRNRQQASASDPKLDNLNGMLDKIYKIQHPELVSIGRTDTAGPKSESLPTLHSKEEKVEVAQLDSNAGNSSEEMGVTGFIDIEQNQGEDSATGNTIAAVIPVDQQLVSGATLELRLLQDAVLGKVTIPKNTLVYGKATVNGDRLQATISSIRSGGSIYPVNLQLYDLDGLAGLHIPGAITRDVAKESADQGVNSLGLGTAVDGSLGASAANAGIQAAKTLFSRKIRLVRVAVKSGYQVLLKNARN